MTRKRPWYIVAAICVLFTGFIVSVWYHEVTVHQPKAGELDTQATVDKALKDERDAHPNRILIPTGVFILSVEFVKANDVNVTGYVWQRYRDDVPESVSRGFLLPEQVIATDTVVEERYRRHVGSETVIGWFFDVTLRQPFDYSKYPLDTHDVWLRLWHKDFYHDVVLVPDLDAYDSTAVGSTFGVDHEIVPGGWKIEETYFSYERARYDTNFGLADYQGQRDFPELYCNVTLSRSFVNAFVVTLIPLIIVLILLYSVLVLATADRDKAEKLGFNTTATIGAATALLFVVMLAHIDFRKEFTAAGLVYLEYFYLITYAAVLGVALNVYLFSVERGGRALDVLHRDDNRIPKLAFWPLILGFLALVTVIMFR